MKTREASLWRWLRTGCPPDITIQRIENALARSTPDVEGSAGHGGFWIELKTAKRPARDDTPIRPVFQPGQTRWLARRWELDSGAWLLLQVGRSRYLIPGHRAPDVEDGVVEELLREMAEVPGDATAEEILRAAAHYVAM